MKRILFVCLGNICRSPMAEGIFNSITDDSMIADSAATSSWEHGNPVYPGTKKILEAMEINTDHMYSRQVNDNDFETFDYIIGMDRKNVRDIMDRVPHQYSHKVHLFMDSVNELKGTDVPDPWYTGDFEETKHLVTLGCEGWKKIVSDKS